MKSALGNYRANLLIFSLGIILIAGGYQLTTRALVSIFGYEIRLIGDISQLIGIVFIYQFFTAIPSFSEFDWQEKIESVLIMHKSGLFIYKKSFREQGVEIDGSVLSGTMTSLTLLLEKLTKKEGLSIIEQRGKYIIIDPGEFLFAAIICDENLASIRLLLHKFLTKIETIYNDVLSNWDHDLKVFEPIEDIAREFFS